MPRRREPELSPEELEVVRAWRAYHDPSRRDMVPLRGGRLLTQRGKLYYDPDPQDPEQRVCFGRTVGTAKELFAGHAGVPRALRRAVAPHADTVDSRPRDIGH